MPPPQRHDEIELKYALEADADITVLLPSLAGPGVQPAEPERDELVATYFDTREQHLGAARITLRRRTGGEDAGWHLKLPGVDGARREIRLPLGRATRTPPVALRRLVLSQLRGQTLVPVAELRTDRTVHRLVDSAGTVLAEVADDRVQARRLLDGGSEPEVWRELEVELVGGDRDLLAAVDGILRDNGVAPAGHASKLSRAMGRPEKTTKPLRPKSSARKVVLAHVAEQVDAIRAQDPLVRLDEEDSVHKMRVATRRLRSALKTYRPLFDTDVSEPLRDTLTWLAGELGAARDAEVLRDRLLGLVADEDESLLLGPVAQTLDATLGGRYRTAHDAVLAELDGPRYAALLADLDRFVTEPPTTSEADGRAKDVLPPLVAKAHRKLRKRVEAARSEQDPHAADLLFHEARKAAKEARYAAESLVPVWDGDAKAYAKAVEGVQEVLGDHQDSVVTRDVLLDLATEDATGAAFTYGRLHAAESARGGLSLTAFDDAWSTASSGKLRRWLG